MTTYIAGPMTGYPEFNYPAFKAAAEELRARGFTVLSPTEHTNDDPPDSYTDERPYGYYLRCSLRLLLDCDEIVLLPGWEDSRGATLEREVAAALGMPITHWAAIADDRRECANCGDKVGVGLSSRDWCDGCESEEGPRGSWQKITCLERDELKGSRNLVPISSCTDMGGAYGDPEIFTEWGDRGTEKPVLRDRRFPALFTGSEDPMTNARTPDSKPCEHYRFEDQS